LTEGSDPSPILGEIDRFAREAHVPVRLVSQRRLESVQGTEAPQGVVAFAEPLTAASLDELVLGWSEGASEDAESQYDSATDEIDDDDEEEEEDDDIDVEDSFLVVLDDIEDGDEETALAVLVDFVEVEYDDDDETEEGFSGVSAEIVADEAPELVVVELESAADVDEHLGTEDELVEVATSDHDDAVPDAGPEETVEELADTTAKSTAAGGVRPKPATSDESSPTAFLILLEGVTDPQNLGAILRSAECAGATGVAVPRHRSVHVTPAVTKAAAGAIEHLQMALVSGIPSALQELERLGVMTVGLDERGTKSLYDLDLGDRPVALVLGSEATGLSPLARRRCDVLCRIPVGGEIPSLNVSAAAAVACFEVARQREARRP
jgi:tRNA G18 (ribose-2'-O)-methylase SpoU